MPIGSERRVGGGYDRQHYGHDGSRTVFGHGDNSPNPAFQYQQFESKEEYLDEREKIRTELAQDFASLRALESGAADIDQLTRLHGMVRKARTVTHPFDAALKEEIFCYAYRLLSPEKREKFLDLFGSNRMLVNLANFLRGQVDAYFQDLDIVKSGGGDGGGGHQNGYRNSLHSGNYSQSSRGIGRNNFSNGGEQIHFDGGDQGYLQGGGGRRYNDVERQQYLEIGPDQCRYCRKQGHRIADCVERNAKLCFK